MQEKIAETYPRKNDPKTAVPKARREREKQEEQLSLAPAGGPKERYLIHRGVGCRSTRVSPACSAMASSLALSLFLLSFGLSLALRLLS